MADKSLSEFIAANPESEMDYTEEAYFHALQGEVDVWATRSSLVAYVLENFLTALIDNTNGTAGKIGNVLLAHSIFANGAAPGYTGTVRNVDLATILADPIQSPFLYAEPDAIEDLVLGEYAIPITASAFTPDTTSSPEEKNIEHGGNSGMSFGWGFDKDTEEIIWVDVPLPQSIEAGTFKIQINYTNTTDGSGSGVVWGVSALALSPGDSLDEVQGTTVLISHECDAGTYVRQVTDYSGDITPAGTWAKGDMLRIKLSRKVSETDDDLAQDAIFLGALLIFTTDQLTDAEA